MSSASDSKMHDIVKKLYSTGIQDPVNAAVSILLFVIKGDLSTRCIHLDIVEASYNHIDRKRDTALPPPQREYGTACIFRLSLSSVTVLLKATAMIDRQL